MKNILTVLAAIFVLTAPAIAAQKTKAQLTSTITSSLPTNGQGQITAAILRSVLQDMVDSDQQIGLINPQTGVTYTMLAGDQGKLVTFNNALPIAVTLPQGTGDFGGGYNFLVQNLGAGAVTISPTVSTINGAATLVLNQNSIAAVFSGSGNYRALTYGTMVSVTCGTGLSGGVITTTGTCSITDTISAGNAGTTGQASLIPHFVWNSRGQLTQVTTTAISAGSLASIPNNYILSNISGVTAAPSANTLSMISDTITSSQGTMLFRGSSGWTGIGPCLSGQVPRFGGSGADVACGTVAGTGTVTTISAGAGISMTPDPITVSGIVANDVATASNTWSATANKMIDASVLNSAGAPATLTDATTVATDMATGVNFNLTLGGNRGLGNPTNTQNGRTGCYFITQDATGSRTMVYDTAWKFAGGTAPTLTTTGGSVDALCYLVRSSTFIWGSMTNNVR